MRPNSELEAAVFLTLLGLLGGALTAISPVAAWCVIALTIIGFVVLAAHHWSQQLEAIGLRGPRKVLSIIGICVSLAGLLISLAAFFWPSSKPLAGAMNLPVTQSPSPTISINDQDAQVIRVSPASQTHSGKRVFTDKSASYIIGIHNRHNNVQATALLEPFIGLFIRIEGLFSNIFVSAETVTVFVEVSPMELVSCKFPAADTNRLATFERDEKLAVIGQIQGFSGGSLSLGWCELQAVS